ncbi:MAG: pyruvate kinase [Oscillospiraceae bacterium]|nr:pyruvate kinase [Oscillospiraceae bacterium]
MRKTKIVATMGPATDDREVLRSLIRAGLDVARFNFSHGTHEEQTARINNFREVCGECGATIAMLADTKGPEIRLGTFEEGKVELVAGNPFTLTADEISGSASRASISFAGLPKEVKPGTRILIDDGLIELSVDSVSGNDILTTIVNGGPVSNRKSVNVPGVKLSLPYISSTDRADLRFIAENGFDILAASFARSADDIREIKSELARVDGKNKIRIIAKIENAEGIKNIDSILDVADGLMVARGDLGVEVAFEELPIIQKELITKALYRGKEVITATQMLESMINNPRPTRAETSDVANAIYDGTSAIMLSGETAMGKYPVAALSAMAKIAERIENSIDYRERFIKDIHVPEKSITNAISHATVTAAHELDAAAILTVTMSGITARSTAKYRPLCPIIACTPDPVSARQLKLEWGVVPVLTQRETDTSELFEHALRIALDEGYFREGDLVVLTAGVPIGNTGNTNLLKVHVVGEKVFIY